MRFSNIVTTLMQYDNNPYPNIVVCCSHSLLKEKLNFE